MFNPKQALEKIRKSKLQKQQGKNVMNEVMNRSGTKPLFPTEQNQTDELNERVTNLEKMVLRLNQQLLSSNEYVAKLKRQNSQLETQLLKLQYENSQIRNSGIISQIRQNISQRLNQNNNEQNNSHLDRSHSHNSNSGTRIHNNSNHQHQTTHKKIQTNGLLEQTERYSLEVQQVLDQVKRQPIEKILKKKQHQFRALKATTRQIQTGNTYLQKLANLQKQYANTMQKPTIFIKLQQADFQI